MINEKDISIVIQGPILTDSKYNLTEETTKIICQRLRRLFPESEIILSTWEGSSVKGIPYDNVIFNKDPGATWFNYYDHKMLNNCNRLIISTLAGLKLASRKYVLKVRSDLFLMSKKFLKYFDKYPSYNEEYKFVKSRIIAFSMWSILGHKTCTFTMPKPYHISDWAYFGYKEDLINLFEVPLIEEPNFSQWFLNRCKPFKDTTPQVLWRMPPEQHITTSFLKKYIEVQLEHTADDTNNNMQRSSKLLMNNFIVLDQTQFFFISLKHFIFQFCRENHEWFIYHSTWLTDYYNHIATDHSTLNKIKFKTKIISRVSIFFLLNNFLRIINYHGQYIQRFFAYCLKRSINKKT